jgi:predicted flap endonuclease-1-like 5' DNA nuclease
MVEVEKLLEDGKTVASVPEEMEVPAPVEEVVEEASEGEPAVQPVKGLAYIEGVGTAYSQKLQEIGITNVAELLDKGSTVQGRKQIADFTGISDKLVLRWVNMADLYRIKGIGQEYAELLEAAGVDTVPELAMRNPSNLLEKMVAANDQKKMVRRLPTLAQVEGWVEQAKSLPRVVTY